MKKIRLAYILAGVLIASAFGSGVYAQDADGRIEYLKESGYVSGYEDGSLNLDRSITRAEMTKLLVMADGWRNASELNKDSRGIFTDVKPGFWANGYINAAVSKSSGQDGIFMISGYPDGTFRPDREISYAELMKMAVVLADRDMSRDDYDRYGRNWPEGWIARGQSLGLDSGADIKDYSSSADRRGAFTVMYNVLERKGMTDGSSSEKGAESLDDAIKRAVEKAVKSTEFDFEENSHEIKAVLDRDSDVDAVNAYIDGEMKNTGESYEGAVKKAKTEMGNKGSFYFKESLVDDIYLPEYSYLSYGTKSSLLKNSVNLEQSGGAVREADINIVHSFEYYMDREILEGKREAAEKKADEVIRSLGIDSSMDDYRKALLIHDYIVDSSSYSFQDERVEDFVDNHSAYGVLVNKKGVCDSYSRAYQLLCRKAGLDCIYVIGAAGRGGNVDEHSWNKVRIDGKWYNVDTTWDDPYVRGQDVKIHDYFLKSDRYFSSNHRERNKLKGYEALEDYPAD